MVIKCPFMVGDGWDDLREALKDYALKHHLWNDRADKPKMSAVAEALSMDQGHFSQFWSGEKGGSLRIVAAVARLVGASIESLLPAHIVAQLPKTNEPSADVQAPHQARSAIHATELRTRSAIKRLEQLANDILLAADRAEEDLRGKIRKTRRASSKRRREG